MQINFPVTVLHVEDDNMYARAFTALMPKGFEIVTTPTLSSALRYLSSHLADICVLDLNLPDSSGTSTLRKFVDCAAIPVIVVTALNDDQLAVKSFRLGAVAFFTKTELVTPAGMGRLAGELRRNAVTGEAKVDELLRLSDSIYHRVLSAYPT